MTRRTIPAPSPRTIRRARLVEASPWPYLVVDYAAGEPETLALGGPGIDQARRLFQALGLDPEALAFDDLTGDLVDPPLVGLVVR